MGRLYAVTFEAVTLTAAGTDFDLFELTPADDKPVAIHHIRLGQSTEVGDAAEEILRVSIVRGNATTGNGTAYTPDPLDFPDVASGCTAKTMGATIATTGTPRVLYSDTWNVRVGWDYTPTPETMIRCKQGQTLICIRSSSTAVDDITLGGTLVFEEL